MSEKMTREDVVRIARECGNDNEHTLQSDMDFLVVFAQKVVAAELYACAKGCETSLAGVRSETEWAEGYIQAVKDIAEGLRARGVK